MQRWPSMTTAVTGPDEHELDQRLVERLALVLGVVAGQPLPVRGGDGEGDERIPLGLDPAEHLPRESA